MSHKETKKQVIAISIEKSDLEKVNEIIRTDYPKIKNVSQVFRVALRSFYEHEGYDFE